MWISKEKIQATQPGEPWGIDMKETYLQQKERQSKEVNAFPMAFAFSNEQFKTGMEKLGLTERDQDQVCSIPGGGFIRKSDAKEWGDMFLRHTRESEESMKDPGFAYQAFSYELSNHEYCVTGEDYDTIRSLGYSPEDVEVDPTLKEALRQAKIHSPKCRYY